MTTDNPRQDDPAPAANAPDFSKDSGRIWRLIAAVIVLAAALLVAAVLVFQMGEFQFYRQTPSAWPAASSK